METCNPRGWANVNPGAMKFGRPHLHIDIFIFVKFQENWTYEFSDTALDGRTDNAISKSPSNFIGRG